MPNQGKIITAVNFCLKQKGNIDFVLNKKGFVQLLLHCGGRDNMPIRKEQPLLESNIVAHPRTLRKAREQVKWMVMVFEGLLG